MWRQCRGPALICLIVGRRFIVKACARFIAAVLLAGVVSVLAQVAQTSSFTFVNQMRLKIKLFDGWRQATNAEGPTTFYRGRSDSPLQISWAEYRGKKSLGKASPEMLRDMAVNFGRMSGFGHLADSSGGSCAFGNFGGAIFHSATHPRSQVWIITDDTNYILATFICSKEPDPAELQEVEDIVSMVTLGPENPKCV
jgi:hypothetical protein